MRDDEYRKLRRALEEQRDADLELIQAGHRAKLHALDMLRQTPDDETQKPMETQNPAETEPVTNKATPATNVHDAIEAILPSLPDVFDKKDVIRLLGWEPHRATLHRALHYLRIGRTIAVETLGQGRHATRYRKVAT